MGKLTLVTGLWDIGRGNLSEGWSRNFDYYLEKFEQLLQIDCNMIIYGDEELQKFVYRFRSETNTQFILRNLDWFKQNEFYDKIQTIRNNPNWFNLAGWLESSTQSKLEMYNPLVMSKMFLLHDAVIFDKFDLVNILVSLDEFKIDSKMIDLLWINEKINSIFIKS
jgi:hypothetical protein